MVKKLAQKRNQSSTHVLKTLLALMQGEYAMSDLVQKLNRDEGEVVFNNSVISKYINTCRYCGFEIPKIQNKYYVARIPFGLDLLLSDIKLMDVMQSLVKSEMSERSQKYMDSFISKILHFSNKEIKPIEKTSTLDLIQLFERAVANNRKIRLMFKNRNILECIPLSISKEGGKIFFNVYKKRIRNIDISRLSGIEQLDRQYVNPQEGDQVTVFKLKGGLAKRYEARENERVEVNPDGTITVYNKNENEELLLSRLMRYDDKCEILNPKTYRADMKALITETLKNYGEG